MLCPALVLPGTAVQPELSDQDTNCIVSMYAQLLAHIGRRISLNADEATLLTTFFEPRQLKRKELLLRQGDISMYEAYINKGCMWAFHPDEAGKDHLIRFALEDWWIGDIDSFHSHTPSVYTIEALEDCDLLLYTKAAKDELLIRLPKLEKFFRIRYENGLVALQRRIIHQVSQPAENRYADLTAKFPLLEQRLPQYVIASYLGITPQHLSRIKNRGR